MIIVNFPEGSGIDSPHTYKYVNQEQKKEITRIVTRTNMSLSQAVNFQHSHTKHFVAHGHTLPSHPLQSGVSSITFNDY